MEMLFFIILLLLLSGFFSGSEIAFVTANRLRVEVHARKRERTGPLVQEFLQSPDTFLTTTLVGNNLALVVYATMMAFLLDPPLEQLFGTSLGLPDGVRELAVLTVQTLVASVVVLLFGEIIPKALLREHADRAVFFLAWPLRVTKTVLAPLIWLASRAAALLVKLFRADAASFSQFIRRDFEMIIQESKESGELDLDEEESELLSKVFEMSEIRVRESMQPRTNVVAVAEDTSLEELRQTFIASGHSKLPVYRDNIEQIVGVAFAYDLFEQPASLAEMMRPATFIPETKPSKDLLQEFLANGTSIAIVIDEYGGTAGLVTMEDLLEELFGEIEDEFDNPDAVLRQADENTVIASGGIEIDELQRRFGFELPAGDYETVAGYLLDRLGTIPRARESFRLDGFQIYILQASANRIELVRLVRETA